MALAALATSIMMYAADTYTVTVTYSGTTATVSIPEGLADYVTCSSGTSSHVKLMQASTVGETTTGEIFYALSGSSTDGEFYMEGSYKATVQLNGLELTNPSGPAINIQNGKRIKVSVSKNTTNTLTDGANDTYNGCWHCKGHTEFTGKGTLNVVGNSKHAIYSKEYIEIKNCTINITAAKKDGIHCKEYFLIESNSTVTISGVGDDGIQVEIDDEATTTGTTTDHEDENSGNFYMTGGTLNISSYVGKAIKLDGTIATNEGTWTGFTSADVSENNATAISSIQSDNLTGTEAIYDLNGRQLPANATLNKGIYIIKKGNKTTKIIVK